MVVNGLYINTCIENLWIIIICCSKQIPSLIWNVIINPKRVDLIYFVQIALRDQRGRLLSNHVMSDDWIIKAFKLDTSGIKNSREQFTKAEERQEVKKKKKERAKNILYYEKCSLGLRQKWNEIFY